MSETERTTGGYLNPTAWPDEDEPLRELVDELRSKTNCAAISIHSPTKATYFSKGDRIHWRTLEEIAVHHGYQLWTVGTKNTPGSDSYNAWVAGAHEHFDTVFVEFREPREDVEE